MRFSPPWTDQERKRLEQLFQGAQAMHPDGRARGDFVKIAAADLRVSMETPEGKRRRDQLGEFFDNQVKSLRKKSVNGTVRKIDIRRIHRRWAAVAAREIRQINASLERAIVDMEALPYREPWEDNPSGMTDPAFGPGMAWGYLGEILGAIRPTVREMMDPDLIKDPVILARDKGDEAAFMAALKETGDDLPGKKERRVLRLGETLAAELEDLA